MSRPIRPTTPAEAARLKKQSASKVAKAHKNAKGSKGSKGSKAATPAPTEATPATDADADLTAWIAEQRWFARGGADQPLRHEASVGLDTTPALTVEVVGFGPDRRYQLLAWATEPQPGTDRSTDAPDVADDPVAAGALARFVSASGSAAGRDGSSVQATWLADATPPGDASARPLGGEQSNTSVVIGGSHVLKLFRRVRPGIHPEVEVGRHLASVGDGSLPVADLAGWWELSPSDSTTDTPNDATGTTALGVVQTFVPGALDGWALVLSALAGDPGGILPRLHLLGRSLADLHGALSLPADTTTESDEDPRDDPGRFGTEPVASKMASDVVQGMLTMAATLGLDDVILGSLAASAGAAADIVTAAAFEGAAGCAIRHHGDLHLGQVVWGDRGWVVLDFEGEPGRPLPERRARHTPLRDVAGLLRSLSYAVATHQRSGGHRLSDGWEPAARAAVLDGYLRQVPPALVPTSPVTTRALINLLELEKVVYEIGYERAHRPDWVAIPLGHLHRMTGDQQ